MRFESGSTYFQFEDPAQYPHSPTTTLSQAKDGSSSGVQHVESFLIQTDTWTYSFEDMSDNDYNGLLDWFVNVADGMMNEFTLINDLGVTTVVRFTVDELKFRSNYLGLWEGSFPVEQVQ